jgi:hypothetical protein
VPRPPGLETQGKPVRAFLATNGGGFVHRRECGALHCSHSPSYWPGLPLSLAMVFTGPSPVDAGYCAESYSP